MPAVRRNGKLASCEPCRKGKIRCDRAPDVCGSCARRNTASQCYYHPAPMTRTTFSLYRNPEHAEAVEHAQQTPITTQPPVESLRSVRNAQAASRHSATSNSAAALRSVLADFQQHWQELQSLWSAYYAGSLAPLVPRRVAKAFIDGIGQWINTALPGRTLQDLADDVQAATSVHLSASSSLSEFITKHLQPCPRLEAIGLLCVLAARSFLDSAIRPHLIAHGTSCLIAAREIAPEENDVLLWFAYEHLKLTVTSRSLRDKQAWRFLGDLISDGLVLKFNKNAHPGVLRFVAEMRRRSFAKAYHVDKVMASFLERSPRLSRHHADCDMPADLSDDELVQGDVVALDENGWNTHAGHYSSSWLRVFFAINRMREAIIEYSVQPHTARDPIHLLADVGNSNESWDRLPPHLRYSEQCWSLDLAPATRVMLVMAQLAHLHNNFRVQCILDHDLQAVDTANHILTIVNRVATASGLDGSLRHDFAFMCLYYGMPSATTLAARLYEATAAQWNLAKPLRALSVFIAHLESVANFSISSVNRRLIAESSAALSHAVDFRLEDLDACARQQAAKSTIPMEDSTDTVLPDFMSRAMSWEDSTSTFAFDDWVHEVDWSLLNPSDVTGI